MAGNNKLGEKKICIKGIFQPFELGGETILIRSKLILQDDFPETRKIAESGFGWTKSS
jgi:hypothetical protein